MTNSEKIFNRVVTYVVVLTGVGFGTLTGLVYSKEGFWWVGTLTGGLSAYPLAKSYLRLISMTVKSDIGKFIAWLGSTCIAVIYGIICTIIIHGVMMLITYISEFSSNNDTISLWMVSLAFGEMIGAAVGFYLGAIFSSVYVVSAIKGNLSEAA